MSHKLKRIGKNRGLNRVGMISHMTREKALKKNKKEMVLIFCKCWIFFFSKSKYNTKVNE